MDTVYYGRRCGYSVGIPSVDIEYYAGDVDILLGNSVWILFIMAGDVDILLGNKCGYCILCIRCGYSVGIPSVVIVYYGRRCG